MPNDTNAILALKNAWQGVLDASRPVQDLAASVAAIPDGAELAALDLETYHRLTLAQANAVEALRGLVEQLRRQRDTLAEADLPA